MLVRFDRDSGNRLVWTDETDPRFGYWPEPSVEVPDHTVAVWQSLRELEGTVLKQQRAFYDAAE